MRETGTPRGGPFLSVVINHVETQRFPLFGSTTIGRSLDCNLWLDDPILSRQHCQLEPAIEGDGWAVSDLHSRNGTFVNGRRFSGSRVLVSGDTITVGRAHLTFHAAGYVPPRPAEPEEALKMAPNRAAMGGREAASRPLPSPKVANADTISPGDTVAGARPLPFTRPPATPIVKPPQEHD